MVLCSCWQDLRRIPDGLSIVRVSRGNTTTIVMVIEMEVVSFAGSAASGYGDYHSEYDKSTDWDDMDLSQD